MCMSVPQIAVLRMRISTSLWPTWGFSASVIQIPGSRRVLARVLIPEILRDLRHPLEVVARFLGEVMAGIPGDHMQQDLAGHVVVLEILGEQLGREHEHVG